MKPNSYFRTQMENYSSKYKQDLQERYKSSILIFSQLFDEILLPELPQFLYIFAVKRDWEIILEKSGAGGRYQAHTKELTHLDRNALPHAYLFTAK